MRVTRSSVGFGAMSLIELLCVMAIIAVLAALLLPALGQATARARRIQCIDHLHQIGVGFVGFANEHNGQFPMAVPASADGSLELAQGGSSLQGDFYFSYRHFQAASNELVTPRLLVCPADTRRPATSFAALSNANLSYFIGVNAAFARPTSILAGDRNLTNAYAAPGTQVQFDRSYALRWTEGLHRFKGNLLFSDGHVEQKSSPVLVAAGDQDSAAAQLAFPTLQPPETAALLPVGGSSPAPGASENTNKPPATLSVIRSGSRTRLVRVLIPAADGAPEETPAASKVEQRSTNAVAATAPAESQSEDATLSRVDLWLATVTARLVEKGMWWLYALLLLLVTAALILRKIFRDKKQRAAGPPESVFEKPGSL